MKIIARGSRPRLSRQGLYKVSVSVGADPEYEFCNGDNVVSADRYVYNEDSSIGGILGYSTPRNQRGGEIGVDGSGQQIELRPDYSFTPHGFLTSMRTLFEKLRPYKLLTAGDTFCLGGHIHIGVGEMYEPPAGLLHCLDYYLGSRSLELCGEARGPYKRLSAYEPKEWGFEYRTPPAAIFHTPTSTRIHLKLAKGICDTYFKCLPMVVDDDPQVSASWEELELFLNHLEIIQMRGFYKNYQERLWQDNVVACWVKPLPTVRFDLSRPEEDYDEDEEGVPIDRGLRERDFVGWIGPFNQTSLQVREQWGDFMFNEIRSEANGMISRRFPDIPVCAFGLRRNRGDRAIAFHLAGVTAEEWQPIHDILTEYFHGQGQFVLQPWIFNRLDTPMLWIGFSRTMRDDNGAHFNAFIDSIRELPPEIVEDILELFDKAWCRWEQAMNIRREWFNATNNIRHIAPDRFQYDENMSINLSEGR